MHYVDFDKKTKHMFIRFAIYALLGVVAMAISFLVLLAARGYDVDPATGKVVRNGLVLLWSQPESVDVYVNNQLEDNTPSRLPLPIGKYDLKMSKAGYRDWTKTVNVNASEVIKLNYPRLFPNEIKAEPVATLAGPTEWLQSPDQETLAVFASTKSAEISLYSINDINQPPQVIKLPQDVLTLTPGQESIFSFNQWSADSDYLVIEHINGATREYIRVNVIENEFVNVNKQLAVNLLNVQFDRSENDKLYGTTDGQLRRLNLAEKTISAALAGEIVDYRIAADGRVAAIQKQDTKSNLILIDNDDNIRTLLTKKATNTNQLELGNYDGEDYAVVGLEPTRTDLIWLDEQEQTTRNKIATISGTNNVVYPVSFTGRFAAVTSGDVVTVHDFEKLRVYSFKFTGMTKESLSWFDDGHLITATDKGMIDVVEFDGHNKTNIGKGQKAKIYTDKDFNFFYSLAPAAGGKTTINASNLRP